MGSTIIEDVKELTAVIDLTQDSDGDELEDDVIVTRVEGPNTVKNPAVATLETSDASSTPPPNATSASDSVPNRNLAHNRATLESLRAGDLVEFHRGLYTHWGVSIGEGQIVHLSGEDGDGLSTPHGGKLGSVSGTVFTISGVDFENARVKCDGFWEIANNSKADKNNSKDEYIRPDADHVIVNRALSKIGAVGYNVLWSNCEHFSSWCRYGMGWSEQVDKFLRLFHKGKSMVTSAFMLLGFHHPRLGPYARRSCDGDNDDDQDVPRNQRRFPELEFFN